MAGSDPRCACEAIANPADACEATVTGMGWLAATSAPAELPARIAALGKDIAARETALADPDLYAKNPARFAALTTELDGLRETLEAAELRWLELAQMEEQLAG